MPKDETLRIVTSEVIKAKHLKDVDIAKELKFTSQRVNNYKLKKRTPDLEFLLKWQEVYKEDIVKMAELRETTVSRETKKTKNGTPVPEAATKTKEPASEEVRLLILNLNRFGETNEYLLKRVKYLEDRLGGEVI